MQKILYLFVFFLITCRLSAADPVVVPLGGNTWANNAAGNKCITQRGIENWKDKSIEFTTWVHTDKAGSLTLNLNGSLKNNCELAITIAGITKNFTLSSGTHQRYATGEWNLADTGYFSIHLKAVKSSGEQLPEISEYELSGSAITPLTAFVKNNDGNFFYWGRRGPSVHLKYQVPEEVQVKWFYNEVTVPEGQDVIGSYFMADGFTGGYFGMQVNSSSERRILFSVWSPFSTDDPKKIPADQQVLLIKKGSDVNTGEFGNEGSGGQSFLRYNWKAGNTYKFLLSAEPDEKDNTVFSAYFFAPEKNGWMLIASFKRPKTNSYLKGLHSFLENFIPQQGDKARKVLFGNQWIVDAAGNWREITKASFTYDNTAAKGYRLDYAGGIEGENFFLKNCGFFNDRTVFRSNFERGVKSIRPVIDFSKLP